MQANLVAPHAGLPLSRLESPFWPARYLRGRPLGEIGWTSYVVALAPCERPSDVSGDVGVRRRPDRGGS